MHLSWNTWGLKMSFRTSAHWPTNWESLICNTVLHGKNLLSKYISRTVGSNYQSVFENFTNFTGKDLCCGVFLINPEGLQLYLKETPTQVFSCKICLFPIGWTFFFSILVNSCYKFLFNDVICTYFSVSFYSIAFIANRTDAPGPHNNFQRQKF